MAESERLSLEDVVAIDVHAHVEMSKAGGDSLPDGRFVEIPGRNHVSAVPSRVFRDAAVDFLG